MIRSCDLKVSCFLVGLTLNLSAQQSAPAAPAPPPVVGTLAGHPDWPAAKNPGDVDTMDHLVASLDDVISGPAGNRDWQRFRSLFRARWQDRHFMLSLRLRKTHPHARAM
jgi:hypothetical protein